ncbi:MAG: crotonobetainyl-CoA:carnitine CoA-transferase CaiB-like acyl-CoA transferase [Acidimicrobiales bacterium]|jgi:crotonobetainyl-CoA:carnitine CoA-transferase CaiB-like acyl-CoA transferase
MSEATQPLRGVNVVELAQWVAGPSTGGIMADWGADVIKVEAASGDPQRTVFAAVGIEKDLQNPPFAQDNRGKRSVVLDLASAEGNAAIHKLLANADVFVTNLRPKALDGLGLTPSTINEQYPSLIVAAQSGYGSVGPMRDVAGYDIGAFVSRTGMARTNSPESEPPVFLRGGIGDHTTGMSTTMAVMAKLFDRTRTGKGGLVETSLFQTGAYTMAWDIGIQLNFDRISKMQPRTETYTPMVNSYRASDNRWFYLIGLEVDRHFPTLCEAISRPDLAADERFASAALITKNRVALIAELDEVFTAADLDHWAALFETHEVWWAPCQSLEEVVADPQAEALGLWVETTDAGQPIMGVATPVRFDGQVPQPTGPVPALGEHTEAVLAELDD